MSVGDIIAIVGCAFSVVIAIITSAVWISNELKKVAIAIANSVTHDQCSVKRDNCPCINAIQDINNLIEKIHPRK